MMQSTPLYHTAKGEAYVGNSLELLAELPDNCIDLVMTSPPFALRCQKSYGNVEETEYVQWIKPFGQDNGGAIPSNLLSIPNTESNSSYLRICKELGIERHPARFPSELPAFFIKMLTDEDDVVLDIFGGSNTTGFTAEALRRKWITFEINHDYLSSSVFRFLDGQSSATMKHVLDELNKSDANYFMNKAACALNPSNKAKSKAESKAQGELFVFGATAL